jgi:nicotinamidase-related amidase
VKKGFNTFVVEDAVAAVNVQPGDGAKSFDDMKKAGVQIIGSKELAAFQAV